MTKTIAFLISDNYQSVLTKCPEFLDEFNLLAPIFAEHDFELIKTNWRDETVDWKKFAIILPKACWDYPQHRVEFEVFIKKLLVMNANLKNSAANILWNMRKTYLQCLKNQELSVGEFFIVPQGNNLNLEAIYTKMTTWLPSDLFVAKPSIGSGASNVVRFSLDTMGEHIDLFKKILNDADLIFQPYFPELAQEGEYSYFFFNKNFSYAILKKPVLGDFRAHPLFGVKPIAYEPTAIEIEQVFKFIASLDPAPAYARIDCFKKENALFLIELELIEPYLYFEHAPLSARQAFAKAVLVNI